MPRKKKDEAKGRTKPLQFRLGADTTADLDAIAEYLTGTMAETTGAKATRADAVRYAARKMAEGLKKGGQ